MSDDAPLTPQQEPILEEPTTTESTPEVSPEPMPELTDEATLEPTKSKKFLLPLLAGIVLLGLSGVAYGYFGVYQQTPANIWKRSLNNTSKGLQGFSNKAPTSKKGVKVEGSFKITEPTAADGTIKAASYATTTLFTADAGAAGFRANVEVRALPVTGATSPDIYLKVNGLKGIAGLAGLGSQLDSTINGLENKWFFVDHTLLDQAAQNVTKSKTPLSESPDQLQKGANDIAKKMTTVINDRLLSTDSAKAVLAIKSSVGKEQFKGRPSEHLIVQVRKQQLRDFAVAMKDALKTTKAKDWMVGDDTTKTFEQAINFDSLLKDIDNANYDNAYADVWLDTGLDYVRDVRINASDGTAASKSYVDFLLDYTGGDDYPISLTIADNDANNSGTVTIGVDLNKKNDDIKLTAAVAGTFSKQKVAGTATVTISPSDDKVTVEKPTDAVNLMNLVSGFLGKGSR